MRKLTESAKIRIVIGDGAVDIQGKGDAALSMLRAFKFLSADRREWLILKMQVAHKKMMGKRDD